MSSKSDSKMMCANSQCDCAKECKCTGSNTMCRCGTKTSKHESSCIGGDKCKCGPMLNQSANKTTGKSCSDCGSKECTSCCNDANAPMIDKGKQTNQNENKNKNKMNEEQKPV